MSKFTGKELYGRWADAMADQNISVDSWSELEEDQRYAWEQVAESVSSESTPVRG